MPALIDCNNFFVECELTQRPQLRGRAVVVGGNGKEGGCVTAMSNQAKAIGITRGTPVYQLKNMVKSGEVVVLPSNFSLYKRISQKVMETIESLSLPTEIYSIDEAFVHFPDFNNGNRMELCRHLRRQILENAGVPVSIGISTTKTLAKIATRFAKKYRGYNGVCSMESEEKIDKGLTLTAIDDVWGIGNRTGQKMREMGIDTAMKFKEMSREDVEKAFAKPTQGIWHELNGRTCSEPLKRTDNHLTCRYTRTFESNISEAQQLLSILATFCDKLARRLRFYGRLACELEVFISTNPYNTYSPQRTGVGREVMMDPTADTLTLMSAVGKAFMQAWMDGFGYKRAGICVNKTVSVSGHTESLFANHKELRRRERLMNAMDRLSDEGLRLCPALAL